MIAVVLGLTSSLCWGIADFMGGVASRRISVLTVLVISQIVGLLLLLVVVAIRAEGPPEVHHLAVAALSSVAGVGALAAFYRGLAVGSMSVVAPISATAAVIPVVAGVATGERPGVLQVTGIVLAVTGVVLASREKPEEGEGERHGPGRGPRADRRAGLRLLLRADRLGQRGRRLLGPAREPHDRRHHARRPRAGRPAADRATPGPTRG